MRKQEKVKKMSELLKIFVSAEYARLVREIVAKKIQFNKDFRTDGAHISKS